MAMSIQRKQPRFITNVQKKINDFYYHCFLIFSWKLYTERHIHKTLILYFIVIHILIFAWSTGTCHFKFSLSKLYIFNQSIDLYNFYLDIFIARITKFSVKKTSSKNRPIHFIIMYQH